MIDGAGNAEWQKIVFDVRKKVVRHFPQLKQSIDFGAYISPQNYFVSYIFKTDKALNKAKESGLLEEITKYHKSLMEKEGYPAEAIKDCIYASIEDCNKTCGGNWYYYYK